VLEKKTRAQRRARKEDEGSKARSKGKQGLKGTLKKEGKVRKRTTLDGQGLEGALERK
jgi:hypothetical protein